MSGRVLVTGATGFVGRRVVEALVAEGAAVVGSSRTPPPADPRVADWLRADLLADDPAELVAAARAETLVHLAWIATPGIYATSPANRDWLSASIRLAEAFLAGGGMRIVGVGTCLEYDLCEDRSTPRTPYGAAKRACRIAFEDAASGRSGASAAWARLFFLLGPDDHPDRFAPSLARRLARGEPAEMSSGEVERDFIDVRDAGAAIAALARSDAAGAFDVASGRSWRLRDLGAAIARAAGRPDLLCVNPALDRSGEPARLVGDPESLRRATGFSPAYSIERSIADILNAQRAE